MKYNWTKSDSHIFKLIDITENKEHPLGYDLITAHVDGTIKINYVKGYVGYPIYIKKL